MSLDPKKLVVNYVWDAYVCGDEKRKEDWWEKRHLPTLFFLIERTCSN